MPCLAAVKIILFNTRFLFLLFSLSFPSHHPFYKMVSQRINSVDLSCCSLEQLPPNLFYSHDLTHLNLKHNFLTADQRLQQLQRYDTSVNINTPEAKPGGRKREGPGKDGR